MNNRQDARQRINIKRSHRKKKKKENPITSREFLTLTKPTLSARTFIPLLFSLFSIEARFYRYESRRRRRASAGDGVIGRFISSLLDRGSASLQPRIGLKNNFPFFSFAFFALPPPSFVSSSRTGPSASRTRSSATRTNT